MQRRSIHQLGFTLSVLTFTPACVAIPSVGDTDLPDPETEGTTSDDTDSIADDGPGSSGPTDTGAESGGDDETGTDSADTGEDSTGDETGTPEPTCGDAVQNGGESDVDCGGRACSPCAAEQVCFEDTDCASGVCLGEICQAPSCGDGVVQDGEECDAGGESDECDLDCTFAECGDATLNTTLGEQCDGGGRTDACNDDCTLPECGDGNTNEAAGETCDDAGESTTCNANCSAAQCGDGVENATAGEDCDTSGETLSCDADCTTPTCGDGYVNEDAGEQCDDGGESAECNADCTLAECGDGLINAAAGEDCEGSSPENANCDECKITCQAGFSNCDGDASGSCEVQTCDGTCDAPGSATGLQTFEFTGSAEQFVVPSCAQTLRIEVWGAQGGDNASLDGDGGLGARMRGDFLVDPGTTLEIVVGERGADATEGNAYNGAGGGGGGSFVWVADADEPLVVAGGGGGSSLINEGAPHYYGKGGVTGADGTGSRSHDQFSDAPGGTNGGDGKSVSGSGGHGWLTVKDDPAGVQACNYGGDGGFGGGGGSGCAPNICNELHTAGAGGGYSGGGAGGDCYYFGGGGGGSYNAGTEQDNADAVQPGHGQVVISW